MTNNDVENNEVELSNGIRAQFITEQFTYYNPEPVSIELSLATTTSGGRLVVSDSHDVTGVMLWPASHLMCQYLIQGDIILQEDETVVELGCGCGLVSLVGGVMLGGKVKLWIGTDVDNDALELCRKNFDLHGIATNNSKKEKVRIRRLAWGNEEHITDALEELRISLDDNAAEEPKFDAVVGADIVYPDTNHETLVALFRTVDALLKPDGSFWLAFATRDGAKTPSRLLNAAGEAGFAVSRLPSLAPDTIRKLPPLLDSKLLVLRRAHNAEEYNTTRLGGTACDVFPGLRQALERLENPSSDEEWEAPYAD